MDKSRIMTLAREGRGFILGRNTQGITKLLVMALINDGKLKIAERFSDGDGCRVVPRV